MQILPSSPSGYPRAGGVMLLLIVLASTLSEAQINTTCTSLSLFDNVPLRVKYRRSVAGANTWNFGPLDGAAIDWAIPQGAETWNELADGRAFVSTGYSSLGDLPNDSSLCASQGIDYSLVRIRDECATSRGRVEPRCGGTQFTITIARFDANNGCVAWNYSLSQYPGFGQYDMIQVLTHEFGHTLGLQHPVESTPRVFATMTPTVPSTTRARDPFWWDQRCFRDTSRPQRDMEIRYVPQTGGVFGSPVTLSSGSQAAYGNYPTKWGPAEWYERNSNGAARAEFIPSGGSYIDFNAPLLAPRTSRWGEVDGYSLVRVLHLSRDEEPQYDPNGKHWVQMRRSNNSYLPEDLGRCITSSSFLTCASSGRIYSGLAVATAWDNYNNRTVVAWVDQRRDDSSSDRQVLISVGQASATVLAEPSSLGVLSLVSPGLACNAFSAGGYDCIVAYVDVADLNRGVRVRRFYNYGGAVKYVTVLDPVIQEIGGAATVSSVAAWFNSNSSKFNVAVKSPSGALKIWTSPTGATGTWTLAQTGAFDTGVMTGPTAVGYNNGDNKLMYLRSP